MKDEIDKKKVWKCIEGQSSILCVGLLNESPKEEYVLLDRDFNPETLEGITLK